MPSKLNSPSAMGEAEEEAEVPKEEGAITVTLILVEDTNNRIRIRVFSLKEAEGEDQMTKSAYNAITAKIMGTMNLNVGRSKQISYQVEHMCQITQEKTQKVCFFRATRLNNNLKISSCWKVDATII